MSIYSAMRSGVTGLNANSSAMAVISDNIANLNTVGYKRGQTDFSAILNAQNASTSYNAGGVLAQHAALRRSAGRAGNVELRDRPRDQRLGLLYRHRRYRPARAAQAAACLRARAPSRSMQTACCATRKAITLMGAPMTNGSATSISPSRLASLQVIDLSNVGSTAEASTKASINANLDSREAIYGGTPAYAAGAMAGYPAGSDSIAPRGRAFDRNLRQPGHGAHAYDGIPENRHEQLDDGSLHAPGVDRDRHERPDCLGHDRLLHRAACPRR